MYYSIRNGTDGIGLDFDFGVFADSIPEARTEAAEMLRNRGFELQADKGLFTVHGHDAWILATDENGYKIVPDKSPEPRKITIIKLDADSYAARITEFAADSPELPSAEAGTTINVTTGPDSTVHVAENMTFNNLRIGS
jgi:hypothetical protein